MSFSGHPLRAVLAHSRPVSVTTAGEKPPCAGMLGAENGAAQYSRPDERAEHIRREGNCTAAVDYFDFPSLWILAHFEAFYAALDVEKLLEIGFWNERPPCHVHVGAEGASDPC